MSEKIPTSIRLMPEDRELLLAVQAQVRKAFPSVPPPSLVAMVRQAIRDHYGPMLKRKGKH